jgi:nitroimidazol reductase NimA-like FMN-containing flavoprotein (pyridoxamine 5'-phosphate oxidase superfamily)
MSLEPTARRPRFHPGYGIAEEEEGMLDWDWAVERLTTSRNYWIGSTRPDGRPHAMPVWGAWWKDQLVFGTSRGSRKARNLARDPHVVAHLESGDEVVILEGVVEELRDPELLRGAYAELSRKYDMHLEPGDKGSVTYVLRLETGYAWTERDYPRTATRFEFGNA